MSRPRPRFEDVTEREIPAARLPAIAWMVLVLVVAGVGYGTARLAGRNGSRSETAEG